MFDFFRLHTRLFQFVLVLLVFPSFVFFGIQGYSRFSEGARQSVAKVDGHDISQADWDSAHRLQIERARQQMPNLDASLFDTPELKRATLDNLIRERVMLAAANRLHMTVSDDRLQRLFISDPQLAMLRNPDGSVNKEALMAQGMSSEQFAERLREDYSTRQVMMGLTDSALAPASATAAALDALFQQREIQLLRFDAKDYVAKAEPTEADIAAYYKNPANAAQFKAPEQASIEYVVLDLAAVTKTVTVAEDELRKYYDENKARFSTPEERRASHILIKVDKGASAADRAKAKAKAESLLGPASKSAEAFAELAKKNSDDPGSAEKGGDLDYFGRGAMAQPFEDAVFALKPGQTSGVVETEFGYHIIRLTDVRGGDTKSFESARPEIEATAKKQQAQKRYAEAAEQFSNTVYEQADSLKPAADKLKLEVQKATVQREPTPETPAPLANAKLLAAVFTDDARVNKRNTAAIETGPNQLVSAHVDQYTPARQKSLDEMRAQIHDTLVKTRSAELAKKDGEARLAAGRKDANAQLAPAAVTVSRAAPHDVPQPVLDAVLKADAEKPPAWVGVDLGNEGYAVARINKVLGRDPVAADATQAQRQYAQAWTNAEMQAYYAALKTRYKVEISPKALVPAESTASAAQ